MRRGGAHERISVGGAGEGEDEEGEEEFHAWLPFGGLAAGEGVDFGVDHVEIQRDGGVFFKRAEAGLGGLDLGFLEEFDVPFGVKNCKAVGGFERLGGFELDGEGVVEDFFIIEPDFGVGEGEGLFLALSFDQEEFFQRFGVFNKDAVDDGLGFGGFELGVLVGVGFYEEGFAVHFVELPVDLIASELGAVGEGSDGGFGPDVGVGVDRLGGNQCQCQQGGEEF